MMREGAKVAYTGTETGGMAVGDRGKVVVVDGTVCHVLWTSGSKEHQITPHYESSLVSISATSDFGLDDSLEVGGLMTFSARNSFDAGGSVQVVDEMAEMGHLASFSEIAEEAIALVAARVRQDPSFRAVTAELDEDEADEVFRLASACLIRDAFKEDDGDGE